MNNVTVLPEPELDRQVAAQIISLLGAAVASRGRATFIGSAGRTPTGIYAQLVRRGSELDWSRVTVVQMDDYQALAPDDHRGLAHLLRTQLVEPVGAQFVPLNDAMGRLARTWPEHEALASGCDLVMHGIGRNGHLGFNEPASAADAPSRVVALAEETVADNGVGLTTGVTLGLSTLLTARHTLVVAKGLAKAGAVAAAVEGPVGPQCPASWLRQAPGQVAWWVDPAAADQLSSSSLMRRGVTTLDR